MVVKMPRLKREWVGRRVLSLAEIRNGWGAVPAGTVLVVSQHRGSRQHGGGLTLESEKRCDCCGLKAVVSGVRENDVQLLPEL